MATHCVPLIDASVWIRPVRFGIQRAAHHRSARFAGDALVIHCRCITGHSLHRKPSERTHEGV